MKKILEAVKKGKLSVDDALKKIEKIKPYTGMGQTIIPKGSFSCRGCGEIVNGNSMLNSTVHSLCWMCLEDYD